MVSTTVSKVQSCGSGRRLTDKFSMAEDRMLARAAAIVERGIDAEEGQRAANIYIVVSVLFTTSIKTEVRSQSETTLNILITISKFELTLIST